MSENQPRLIFTEQQSFNTLVDPMVFQYHKLPGNEKQKADATKNLSHKDRFEENKKGKTVEGWINTFDNFFKNIEEIKQSTSRELSEYLNACHALDVLNTLGINSGKDYYEKYLINNSKTEEFENKFIEYCNQLAEKSKNDNSYYVS
jgi:hypothetical protein